MSNYDKIVQIYELYEQKMYGVAFSILHNSWQAEDAVSEAFVKLIRNIKKIKDVESVQTKRYVIRIIQNVSIDLYRKNQRERAKVIPITEENRTDIPDEKDEIEEMLAMAGDREAVDGLLCKLSQPYQDVLKYRILHDLSVEETAAILEIKETLVRKRYERAKKQLQKEIGEGKYERKII